MCELRKRIGGKMTEDMRNTMITVNDNTVWIDIDMTIH